MSLDDDFNAVMAPAQKGAGSSLDADFAAVGAPAAPGLLSRAGSALKSLAPTAIRVAPALIGGAIGSAIAPGPGTAIGAAIGGGLGEAGAEKYEGQDLDPTNIALSTALSAVPAGPAGRLLAKPGLGLAARAGLHLAEGATQGVLGEVAHAGVKEGRLPTGSELMQGAEGGALLGGALGLPLDLAHGAHGVVQPESRATEHPIEAAPAAAPPDFAQDFHVGELPPDQAARQQDIDSLAAQGMPSQRNTMLEQMADALDKERAGRAEADGRAASEAKAAAEKARQEGIQYGAKIMGDVARKAVEPLIHEPGALPPPTGQIVAPDAAPERVDLAELKRVPIEEQFAKTEAPTDPSILAKLSGPTPDENPPAAAPATPPAEGTPEQRVTSERRIEDVPVAEDQRTTDRRARVAQEIGLPPEHPAVDRVVQAETDPLTGLPGRAAYERELTQHQGPVVSMDLAGLGYVNDHLGGHPTGDAFLKAFAKAAQEEPGVRVFRAGEKADEFALLADSHETAAHAANSIQDRFSKAEFSGLQDGKPVTYTGGRVDYGIGEGRPNPVERAAEADTDLYRARKEAVAQGLRSDIKGQRPVGLREIAGPGDVADQGSAPPDALAAPPAEEPSKPLYRVGPKGEPQETLGIEHIKRAFVGREVVPLEDGAHQVKLANGRSIRVQMDGNIDLEPKAFKAGYEREAAPGEQAVGSFQRIGPDAVIRLSKEGASEGTLSHESFHAAMDMTLTPKEKALVLDRYKTEEAAAEAYSKWSPEQPTNNLFQRIRAFFQRIYRAWKPDAESVFGKVRSGEAFGREAVTGDGATRYASEFPKRTADTMSDAIALSSPSGSISKRGKDAAINRLGEALFGPDGATREQITGGPVKQPSELERLVSQAARLRDLASRGMNVKKFTREAERVDAEIARLDSAPKYATAPAQPPDVSHLTEPGEASQQSEEPSRPLVEDNVRKLREAEGETPGAKPADLSRETPRTNQELTDEAKRIDKSYTDADFYRQMKKGPLDDAETVAWRNRVDSKATIRNTAQDALDAARTAGKDTTALQNDYANKSLDYLKALTAHVETGTAQGRALQARNVLEKFDPTSPEAVGSKLVKLGIPQESIQKVVEAVHRGDPQEINRALVQAFKPSLSDKVYEAWINGMLSAPSTSAIKGVSDLLSLVGTGFERGAGSVADAGRAKWTNSPRERIAGEVWAHFAGMKAALQDALGNARKAWHEEPTGIEGSDPLNQSRAPYAIGGTAGKIIRAGYGGGGTRGLRAIDAFSKTLARSAEKHVQALRIASSEGGSRAEVAARAQQIASTPDHELVNTVGAKRARAMTDSMDAFMNRATYTAPYGPRMQAVANAINKVPGGDVVFPFMRVPWNLAVEGAKATPMNMIKVLADIKSGKLTGAAASDALVRPLMGTAAMMGVAMATASGQVTGNGPEDPNARKAWMAAGNQPYSVKVPGAGWVSYKRIEPFATIIGLAADSVEATHEKKKKDMALKAVAALEAAFTQKTFLTGVEDIGGILKDPIQYGKQFAQDLESSVVPNIAAKAAQAIDPTVRDASFESGALAPIEARIPGLTGNVPAKPGMSGETIERGGTAAERMLSPFPRAAEPSKYADLDSEMARLGFAPGAPKREMPLQNGKKVDLTDDEMAKWAKIRERAAEMASRVLNSPTYKGAVDTPAEAPLDAEGHHRPTKEDLIKQYFSRADQEFRARYLPGIIRRARTEGAA